MFSKVKSKRNTGVAVWEPLPGFDEVAPNVWLPDGYDPNPYERPSPIIETTNQAAVEYLKCQQSLPYFVTTHCWTLHVDDPLLGHETGCPQVDRIASGRQLIDHERE